MGQYERIMGTRMKSYPILEWHQALEEMNFIDKKCGLRRREDWALVSGLGYAGQDTFGQLKSLFSTQAHAAFAGKGPEAIIAILSRVVGFKLPGGSGVSSSGERDPRLSDESFQQFTSSLKPDATAADLPEAEVELARNEAIVWAGRDCLESAIAEVEPAEAMKLGVNIVKYQWPLELQ